MDVSGQFQTPRFPAPRLVSARQRYSLLRLLPRLGDPSKDEIGLGQERDEPRTAAQNPHRRARFDCLLQQRHRVGRAPQPESGGAQERRDERQREANLRRPAEREAWLQHPGCRRKVPVAQMGGPEAPAGPDLAVRTAGGLGDPQALFPCGDGLGELSQFRQDHRKLMAGGYRPQRRQPEALAEQRALEEGDSRAQGIGRPAQVAGELERLAQAVVRIDAQPEVAGRFGDGARALPRLDRPSLLAKEAVEVRQIPERPPESPLVPEPLRQRAPLAYEPRPVARTRQAGGGRSVARSTGR